MHTGTGRKPTLFRATERYSRLNVTMRFRILDIGPDSRVHRSLLGSLEVEGLGIPQHIETGGIALDILCQLPESELPHIVVIPFRLPILTGVDFIVRMRSHERLRCIPIFVWGSHIPASEIDQIYIAGATCVLPGNFSAVHLDALREFCRNGNCIDGGVPSKQPADGITSALSPTGEKAGRNTQLGALFVWTGCVSTALWIVAFLQLNTCHAVTDFVPLPVYAALASAGFSLMWSSSGNRAREQH
jgi:CheY-like chemotaxis protein